MTDTEPGGPPIEVRCTADLLALVPYVIGFHPAESLVALGVRDLRVVFGVRVDLPGPDEPVEPVVEYVAGVVVRQRVNAATVIGYGPADRVDRVLPAARRAMAERGLLIHDVLRVDAGRYWSYGCPHPECAGTDGVPFDVTTSPVTAALAYSGEVALPDRAALVAMVAPVTGPARESMRDATLRAEQRLLALLAPASSPAVLHRTMLTAGDRAVREAMARQRAGKRLTDDEVAWLTLLLTSTDVRDAAWRLGDRQHDVALWADVLRRAEPDLVAAPAALLAFAAWQDGNGALAGLAVDRALHADPAYPLAMLLDEALRNAVAPSTLDGWPDLPPTWSAHRIGTSGRVGRGTAGRADT